MRLVYQALLVLFSASTATAQSVSVRTGEHETFTRVVLSIPVGADWQFGRSSTGYTLRMPDIAGYQLGSFYNLIPRTRIESVAQNSGDLALDVTCDCNARAYLFDDRFLVIDVSDGPPRRISPFELSLDPPQVGPGQAQGPTADRSVAAKPAEAPIVGSSILPLFFSPVQPAVAEEPPNAEFDGAAQGSSNPDPPGQDYIDEISQDVALALGAAMSGGFLEGEISSVALEDRALDSIGGLPMAGELALPGVETRTGIDPATQETTGAQTQTGASCLPDSYFDIASWADDRSFNAQLGEARQNLYGEFDLPDPIAVERIAKIFLHFGFGREALQSLALDQVQSRERIYLQRIAQIVDGETGQIDGFAGQISCAGRVGMWAMLATGDAPIDGQVDRSAVLREFKSLPVHLRPVLGPKLARGLLRSGDLDGAEQVLERAISQGLDPSAAALSASDLAQASGDVSSAFFALQSAVAQGDGITPETMAEFFDLGVAVGAAFSDADFELADAVRFQSRLSQAGIRLSASQFRAYLAQGEFDEARLLLSEYQTTSVAKDRSAMEAEFQTAAIDRMTDAAFGRLVWEDGFRPMDAIIRQDAARRLEGIGFVTRANEIANMAVDRFPESDGRNARVVEDPTETSTAPRNYVEPAVDNNEAVGAPAPAALTAPSLQNAHMLLEASKTARNNLASMFQENQID